LIRDVPDGRELLRKLAGRLPGYGRRVLTVRPGERAAAVLVPLLPDGLDGEPAILLERRSERLPHHAGQYGFPGGAVEPTDSSPEAAALREAREETGMAPESVELLGRLSDIRTPTLFVITPVVVVVRKTEWLAPASCEVEELIRVPLALLIRPGAFRRVSLPSRGLPIHGDALIHDGRVIWGATARILLELRRLLAAPGSGPGGG